MPTTVKTTGSKYQHHEAAGIFSMMTGEPYEAFKECGVFHG